MDEYSTHVSNGSFNPPSEGMLPGEEIVWTRRPGYGFWVYFAGMTAVVFGLMFGVDIFDDVNDVKNMVFLPITIILLLPVIFSIIRTRLTRYYLTNERILITRSGHILKEIPRQHFAGKPLKQFIEYRVAYTSNNQPVYEIRIYDPVSNKTIELKNEDEETVELFEQIGNVRECPYCNYCNPVLSSKCKNCGAVL